MIEQKKPRIKNTILNFFSGLAEIFPATEIFDEIQNISKSKTPKKSIYRTLNELYEKNYLKKYYFVDGKWKRYPLDKEEAKSISNLIPRGYQLIQEYYRKEISTTMYCGTGLARKSKVSNGVIIEDNQIDVKTYTFDTLENRDKDRFDFLVDEMYEYLSIHNPECYLAQYNNYGDLSNDQEYVKNTSALELKSKVNPVSVMPVLQPNFLFADSKTEVIHH